MLDICVQCDDSGLSWTGTVNREHGAERSRGRRKPDHKSRRSPSAAGEDSGDDGECVVTKPAGVMRLTDDLDDVISRDTTACVGTQLVMILAGYGQSVTTIDVSVDGCSEIYGSQLAEYQGTALAQDLDTALAAT